MRPYYLGIGAPRCGTTGLHDILKFHPEVSEYRRKELHFWDQNLRYPELPDRKEIPGYLAQFKKLGEKCGEITPAYYRVPGLPSLLRELLPDLKILVLLRNPIDGLSSGYRRSVHRGKYPESFEEHVEAFLNGSGSDEFFVRRQYATHLQGWFDAFPRGQMWIVQSEALWRNPAPFVSSLWRFLDVKDLPFSYPKRRPRRPIHHLPPELRERLARYFRPHNERLYSLLGERYDWDE